MELSRTIDSEKPAGTGTSALSLLVSFNLYAILIQLPPHDTGTESG